MGENKHETVRNHRNLGVWKQSVNITHHLAPVTYHLLAYGLGLRT